MFNKKDTKYMFNIFEIELKDGVDVSYPDIKLISEILKEKKNKD